MTTSTSTNTQTAATAPAADHQMTNNTYPRSITMYLINEALARARMRPPQISSEAHSDPASRGARRIAMRARQDQARALGHLPPLR